MKKAILYTGGVINILLALGHMSFWKILNWSEELPKLSPENQAVLQIANIIIIFVILYFAVMSFVLARYEKFDVPAKSIIVCIIGFYAIRLILGYPFFGFNLEELTVWIICLLIIAGYASVLLVKKKS